LFDVIRLRRSQPDHDVVARWRQPLETLLLSGKLLTGRFVFDAAAFARLSKALPEFRMKENNGHGGS
jgi:hypothetical protein